MTSLTKPPILISLLQTAESLPIFLLVLPAGAFADIMDRGRLLMFPQIWMLIVAATLAIMNIAGATGRSDGTSTRDTSDPSRHVETFVVESWVAHMRQHQRVTISDRSVQERVNAFHIGPNRPIVTHFIYTGKN